MPVKSDAQDAVFEAVIDVCKAAQNASGSTKGQMVRDAAMAYRLAAGGAQPGGVPLKD